MGVSPPGNEAESRDKQGGATILLVTHCYFTTSLLGTKDILLFYREMGR